MMDLDRLTNLRDLRSASHRCLPSMIVDFLEGGADDEVTVRRNEAAFGECDLVPRVLVDVGNIDTSAELLGRKIALPVILSPTGATKLFHPDGEIAVARAAGAANTFYSLSTMSNSTLEDVGAIAGPKIFQLYVMRDRGLTQELIRRAEAARYDALCLTVDMPVGGNRERDIHNRLALPFRPSFAGLLGIARRPRWAANMVFRTKFHMANFAEIAGPKSRHGNMQFVNTQFDRTLSWADAAWFAAQTELPVIIKGVLSPQDACRARDAGARAVMISNHGGRQMDTVPAPFEVVGQIREALGNSVQIVLDGGVRRGSDILKALARGADACSLGRPYLHGLAAGGQEGVERMFSILRAELERNMALLGLAKLSDIDETILKVRS